MTPRDENNLERLISQAVRGLPARPAPSTLEARVQAEIARRAALPWWHKSFGYWPVAARGAFVLFCGAIVKLVLMSLVWITGGFDPAQFKASFATELGWLHIAGNLVRLVVDVSNTVLASIPSLWLYGGAAVIVALYVGLFGLGAAAYRTLYASS